MKSNLFNLFLRFYQSLFRNKKEIPTVLGYVLRYSVHPIYFCFTEEARLQAERDELEKLERERKEKELEKFLMADNKYPVISCVQWEKYMHCDGTPDPAVQRDINTYISLWRDDPEVNITSLVEELEGLLRDVTDPQQGQKYQEALINLQELIHSKHHRTSEEILKRASESIDTETGNMQTVVKDDNITLCLWANLKKDPRSVCEVNLGFQLPKQLAVSDIAVRILHTHYDHLNNNAGNTNLVFPHLFGPRSLAGGDKVPADIDLPEQGETKEDEEVKNDKETQQQRVDEEKDKYSYSFLDNSVFALLAEGDLKSHSVQFTMMDGDEHAQVVDLMQYTPLGGVFYYDVFCLPPQAHQVIGWEIRQVLDTGLQVFPYPTERSNLYDKEALTCPPVGVSMTLPDSVVFLETPQVARWDAAGKQWRMDGITDVSYEEEEAKISFKMESFQAFVLMQETYANLPFQNWELRPLGQDSAVFTVNGVLFDFSIMIQGDQCMLQSEQEKGPSHLLGKWMSGPALQKAMLNVGINIFVNEYTNKYVSTCGKVCEHQGPAPVLKNSWSLYLLSAQRSQKLQITEKSEAFSPDLYPGSEFHSTFIHMLQDNMSTEGIARTRESNYLFIDTVQSLLCATRPLMYS
uniref:Dynein axonemal intermediate chain 7 n=1 Tax=Seriola lalandi dorsalis TaxID=1841481 RepID=A0A3B4XIL8_SERLL